MPGMVIVQAAALVEMLDGMVFLHPHPILRLVRRGNEDVVGVRALTSPTEVSEYPKDGEAAYIGDEGHTKYLGTGKEGGWLLSFKDGIVWAAPLTKKALEKPPGKTVKVEQFCLSSV